MTDDNMPEPVAWRKPTPSGDYLRSTPSMADTPETVDGLNRHGWRPLYTADQLQAYGDKRAADALEEAAEIAQRTVCDTHIPTGVRIYGTAAAKAIRELKGTP